MENSEGNAVISVSRFKWKQGIGFGASGWMKRRAIARGEIVQSCLRIRTSIRTSIPTCI